MSDMDRPELKQLLDHANREIARLKLGDSPTNCHGVMAYEYESGLASQQEDAIRLSDGTGLNVICRTTADIDEELELMANWRDEHGND